MSKTNYKAQIMHNLRNLLTRISPELNTKFLFWWYLKERINLSNPKTFNEKVSWLKLNSYKNNPEVKRCADKYLVREYIVEKGLGELLIPLIDVYNHPEEIDWDLLPNEFALKLNVGCGCNLICTNKANLNIQETIKEIRKWEKEKYYLQSAEWQYKDVEPKFIIEKCLPIQNNQLPADYKFYCINGKCEAIMLCLDREIGNGAKFYYFDRDWNAFYDYKDNVGKPSELEKALEYAETLAKDFPVVRVDLFIEEGKIYFGELTFTPSAGVDTDLKLFPKGMDITLDDYLGSLIPNEVTQSCKR